MVKVQYAQIETIDSVLVEWWDIPGLPIALQRRVLDIRKLLVEQRQQFEELRTKFVADHAKKDNDGKPVISQVKNDDGETIRETYVFVDQKEADKCWAEIVTSEFECPTITESMLETDAIVDNLTPQKLAMIDVIVE